MDFVREPFEFLLDGGVDRNTAPLCVEAGANVLVAGSSIFGAADREAEIKFFRGL